MERMALIALAFLSLSSLLTASSDFQSEASSGSQESRKNRELECISSDSN
jgi:hypothetical protein